MYPGAVRGGASRAARGPGSDKASSVNPRPALLFPIVSPRNDQECLSPPDYSVI